MVTDHRDILKRRATINRGNDDFKIDKIQKKLKKKKRKEEEKEKEKKKWAAVCSLP